MTLPAAALGSPGATASSSPTTISRPARSRRYASAHDQTYEFGYNPASQIASRAAYTAAYSFTVATGSRSDTHSLNRLVTITTRTATTAAAGAIGATGKGAGIALAAAFGGPATSAAAFISSVVR